MSNDKKRDVNESHKTYDSERKQQIINSEYVEKRAPQPVLDTLPPPKPPDNEKK